MCWEQQKCISELNDRFLLHHLFLAGNGNKTLTDESSPAPVTNMNNSLLISLIIVTMFLVVICVAYIAVRIAEKNNTNRIPLWRPKQLLEYNISIVRHRNYQLISGVFKNNLIFLGLSWLFKKYFNKCNDISNIYYPFFLNWAKSSSELLC